MDNAMARAAQKLNKGPRGERLVAVHIGHLSIQDYPSNLTGMWREAYDRSRSGLQAA